MALSRDNPSFKLVDLGDGIGNTGLEIERWPLNSDTLQNTCLYLFVNPGVYFGNLQSITITRCCNLICLFSVSVATRYLSQLKIVCIEYCESMEQVFWNDGNTYRCIEFPRLEQLTLETLPNLTAFCEGLENIIINFPKLTTLEIAFLPSLNRLFPLNWDTLQLEVLWIDSCDSMEQVFWNEITHHNTDGCIEFPKLRNLILRRLPNLTAFCQGFENIVIKFPNLKELVIAELPKLNSLSTLNSETVVGHDQNTCFHFVCNPKVEMGSLKDLKFSNTSDPDNSRNIWCSQIPNNVFNNLEMLEIHYMNEIRSLMSTSIAKNLVSLEWFDIKYCDEMVEVIERDDDDDDKQLVDIKSLFPNLKFLDIGSMPKLRRFWQWNHALELPLLEQVDMFDCPMMEAFTLGSINTPNIREIKVNNKQIHDRKDLNDIIRDIWTESNTNPKLRTKRTRQRSTDEYNNVNEHT